MDVEDAKGVSKWMMALGLVLLILGIIGLFAMEALASILTVVLGIILIIGGVIVMVFGAMAPTAKEKALYIIAGIIALIVDFSWPSTTSRRLRFWH